MVDLNHFYFDSILLTVELVSHLLSCCSLRLVTPLCIGDMYSLTTAAVRTRLCLCRLASCICGCCRCLIAVAIAVARTVLTIFLFFIPFSPLPFFIITTIGCRCKHQIVNAYTFTALHLYLDPHQHFTRCTVTPEPIGNCCKVHLFFLQFQLSVQVSLFGGPVMDPCSFIL